jgi:hypothetical protein
MSQQREFTGVFIPAHIWESSELTPAEKMMLGEIDSLSKSKGYCYAGRSHFAKWLQCGETNISNYFAKLEKLGFISTERIPGQPVRIKIANDRFYVKKGSAPVTGGVSPTDGGGSAPLTGGVSPTDPKYKLNTSLNSTLKKGKKAEEESTDKNQKKTAPVETPSLKEKVKTDNLQIFAAAAADFSTEKEVWEMVSNFQVRETFTMNCKVPAELFKNYLVDFANLQSATEKKHNNRAEFRQHFFNYSRKRYESEKNSPQRPESGLPKNLRRF